MDTLQLGERRERGRINEKGKTQCGWLDDVGQGVYKPLNKLLSSATYLTTSNVAKGNSLSMQMLSSHAPIYIITYYTCAQVTGVSPTYFSGGTFQDHNFSEHLQKKCIPHKCSV